MPGTLTQDLCYAARQLRANPGFAAAAVLWLALGVGPTSAIFQLVDAVRLRTLPVTNPQDLAMAAVNPSMRRSGCRPKAAAKMLDRKSTRLNSSHRCISYAVFCL